MQKLIFEVGNKNVDTIITNIETQLKIKLTNSNPKKAEGYAKKIIEGTSTKLELGLFEFSDLKFYQNSAPCAKNINVVKTTCERIVENAS